MSFEPDDRPEAPPPPARGSTLEIEPSTAPFSPRTSPRLAHGQASDVVVAIALGDVHGLYEPVFAAMRAVPDAAAILQVGDLTAGKPGRETHVDGDPAVLASLPVPLIWIHGNHEHWELFGGATSGTPPCLPGHHLWPGAHAFVPGTGIGVVGLPGNYAPTWYALRKPFPGDRVRHFNRDDVEAMLRHPYPNVLLMHEAFRGQAPGRIGTMGIPVLERLVAQLQPTLVLTGHHHLFGAMRHGRTLALSLPPAWEGYARLEFLRSGALLDWTFVPAARDVPLKPPPRARTPCPLPGARMDASPDRGLLAPHPPTVGAHAVPAPRSAPGPGGDPRAGLTPSALRGLGR